MTTVDNGQDQSVSMQVRARFPWSRRAARLVPKLTVRVRFPSPLHPIGPGQRRFPAWGFVVARACCCPSCPLRAPSRRRSRPPARRPQAVPCPAWAGSGSVRRRPGRPRSEVVCSRSGPCGYWRGPSVPSGQTGSRRPGRERVAGVPQLVEVHRRREVGPAERRPPVLLNVAPPRRRALGTTKTSASGSPST